ncbi:MAG: UDP-N-acetylmuramoyl-tripeptide--D-alanyl-D-alanine ligase [Chlorobi bacterium]|nr:UDP-N-acetylmuramoyl-tripeptide--D-alanyl-D-alanine ligase [Chlorobiota bacterium]
MDTIEQLYGFFEKVPKISTDTRKDVSDSIFFAIPGENFDGNAFAIEAIRKGARMAVIDNEKYKTDDRFFLVDNAVLTLQQLALYHRKKHPVPVIGITGSNGKTTTKELTAAILGSTYHIVATQGNLNNFIGLPLTVMNINKETELAVIELGTNHPGEIEMLCKIARPDVGMITNIGKAHLEGFGDINGVIAEKSELYKYLKQHSGTLFVNADDPLLMKLSRGMNRFTYGQKEADLLGKVLKSTPDLTVMWKFNNREHVIKTRLYGHYNLYNILAAITVGLHFNILPDSINRAIESFTPDNNRSQRIQTAKNRIFMDAYNANPVSMSEALKSFREQEASNPWLIVGDMFELGEASLEEHESIIRLIEELGFRNVILIGRDFYRLKNKSRFTTLASTEEAEEYLRSRQIENADILVKGSRGMQLEKLLTYL